MYVVSIFATAKGLRMKKIRQTKYLTNNGKFRFFARTEKRFNPAPLIVLGVIVACIAIFVAVGLRKGTKLKVTHTVVEHAQVPKSFDGYKILQISDVYGKVYGDRQSKIKELLKDEDYDIVILTGDYFDDDEERDYWEIRDLIECFKEGVPVYYILGDNDYSPLVVSAKSDKWKMCIIPSEKTPFQTFMEEECGATFVYPIQKITSEAGESIYLTGINNDKELMNKYDFDSDVDFSITVTHMPINYDVSRHLKDVNKYTITEIDYDLSIAGHTGGGQYRIPILGTVYDPDEGWFPQEEDIVGLSKDSAGRYNFISAGLGTEKGFRFFSNPEISIIELKYKGEEQ